jgi:hypothetical protein
MAPALETPPQIMVLCGRKVLPASSLKVSIRSHTKIGSVDVGVGSIGVNEVGKPKALGNKGLMLGKRVDVNDSGYGGKSSVCEG